VIFCDVSSNFKYIFCTTVIAFKWYYVMTKHKKKHKERSGSEEKTPMKSDELSKKVRL